eukprot:14474085-Alexandrium_andersonii.AAC.1
MASIWFGSCPTMTARIGNRPKAFTKFCMPRTMSRGKPLLGSAINGNPFFDTASIMSLHPQRTTHGGMPKPRILGWDAAFAKLPR